MQLTVYHKLVPKHTFFFKQEAQAGFKFLAPEKEADFYFLMCFFFFKEKYL